MSLPRVPQPQATASAGGLLVALGVFLTHVPFLLPGYGTDTDTWKFADAIREMSETGRYTASRLPGYPVMEFLCAPLARAGPWAPNALSAVAAAACAWLSGRLFARHGVRDAGLAGAAFAFVPAAFIAGTSSIDYLWAIAFGLAAWLEARDGRGARAGLWFGLAIATRLTSVLFGPSLLILLAAAPGGSRARRWGACCGLSAAVSVACYLPAFQRYGWLTFTYSEISGGQSSAVRFLTGMVRGGDPGVPWSLIAGQATVLLLGLMGSAAVAGVLLSLLWQRRLAPRAARIDRATLLAVGSLVLLEGAFYLRLPHDEGYLLPVVPFVMLALAAFVTLGRFRTVCAAFLLAPFLLGVDVEPPKKGATPGRPSPASLRLGVGGETVVVEPWRGPLLRDRAKRVAMREMADQVERWWPTRPPRFLMAAGNLTSMLYYLFPEPPRERHIQKAYPPAERERARLEGTPIFALPDAARRMAKAEGVRAIPGLVPLAAGPRTTP